MTAILKPTRANGSSLEKNAQSRAGTLFGATDGPNVNAPNVKEQKARMLNNHANKPGPIPQNRDTNRIASNNKETGK